jgi:hypothetical protein
MVRLVELAIQEEIHMLYLKGQCRDLKSDLPTPTIGDFRFLTPPLSKTTSIKTIILT